MKVSQNTKLVLLSLLIVTIVAYFQTLWMYFWIDDNALIYKLQHISTYSGFWGKGIIGEGPYRHIIDQFVPFYPLFKTNPTPYYTIGIFLYFLTSVTVYFFVKTITKINFLAWAAAAIFAAGFVGSESIFGITNSWQTSRGIIMALLTLLFFYKYIKTKKVIFYLLSVVLFFFSLDTVYVRAHGLIFCVIFFDLIFTPVLLNRGSIISFLVRQLPFLTVHYFVYLSSTYYVKNFGILRFLEDVFSERKYQLLFVPIQNIGNLFIPDTITKLVDNFIIQNLRSLPPGFSLGSTLAGFSFLFLVLFLFLRWRKQEPLLTKVLIFAVIWMLGNMVVYFVRETALVLQTTHRYLTYSFAGLAIFWSVSLYLLIKSISKKRALHFFTLFVVLIIGIYLYLNVTNQYLFNQKRSIPARNFFSTFDKAIPDIPKGAVIYFNIANDPVVKGEYNSFFGGMFSEAGNLAILSDTINDYAEDFLVTYNFDEVLEMIKNNKVDLNNVYSFYYSKDGLVQTTSQLRQLLSSPQTKQITSPITAKTEIKEENSKFIGKDPVITIQPPAQTSSLVKSKISFLMSVSSFSPSLPYSTSGGNVVPSEERDKIFSYLISRNNFQKNTTVTAASYWRDQTPNLAIDGRLDTSWRAHRGFWEEIFRGRSKEVEYFSVDLKSIKMISQVKWVSGFYQLVPTHYKILTSKDGVTWKQVLEVEKREYMSSDTLVINSFPPEPAHFVKMEILKTYGNDGPEIKEFEVIDTEYAQLSQDDIGHVENAPFEDINSESQFNKALSFTQNNPTIKFYWMSSADKIQDLNKYIELPIFIDGVMHEYSLPLPAEGINWTAFHLEGFNFPADINIQSPKIIYEPLPGKI